MDKSYYPPLLPASVSAAGPSRQKSHESDKAKPKRKRGHVANVACDTCRAKKVACDAKRPACTRCQKKGSRCVYQSIDESETPSRMLKRELDTLKHRSNAMEELIDHLRYTPKDIAQMILERLRVTSDPALVLRSVQGDMLGHPISEITTARGVLPAMQSGLELELMVRHPVAYPTLPPAPESAFLSGPFFAREVEPAAERAQPFKAVQNTAISSETSRRGSESSGATGARDAFLPSFEAAAEPESAITDSTNPLIGPEAPARYIDKRLGRLAIASWTPVQITNEYAASALSLYLETDHPILGLFDADAFIGDLVDHKLDFCSEFLVNSVLAFASQAYTSRDSRAAALSYDLESEAEEMWRSGTTPDSLPNLAALNFLWLSCLSHGQGEVGRKYIEAVWQVARRMKLFGVPDTLNAADLQALSPDELRATAHTTWGAFNMVKMQSLYAFPACTKYPPLLPIPGYAEDATTAPGGPKAPEPPAPLMVGQVFASFCSFWTLVSDILFVYHRPNGRQAPSLDFAQSNYERLLTWADALSHSMVRAEESSSHVLMFHIWYHAIVLEIFRPFIASEKQHGLRAWSATAPAPEAIFSASLKQLRRLVLLYGTHPSSRYSILWQVALLNVANAALKDPDDPAWRFYFLRCVHGYQRLLPCFPLAGDVVRGLLAIALGAGALSGAEAQLIDAELPDRARGARRPGKQPKRGAGFVLDLDLALTDWDAAQVDRLRDKFDDLLLFDEVTDGVI